MYAVIMSGGKQHRVKEGDVVALEKMEVGVGETVEFDKVLMVANDGDVKVGTPYLEGMKVAAEVVEQGRDKKVKIIKFRRRKHSMTRQGHRQYLTTVKITQIGDAKPKKKAAAKKAEPATTEAEAKKPAAKKTETKKTAAKTEAKKATAKPAAKKATTKAAAKPAAKKTAATKKTDK